ncbi:hypothetical protein, partial [Metamycoplasma hominis]|uniref:hypothetical protein n=1 Tax=Metamycoplasma hominis TaxID=2098 RepID=UPI001C6897A1
NYLFSIIAKIKIEEIIASLIIINNSNEIFLFCLANTNNITICVVAVTATLIKETMLLVLNNVVNSKLNASTIWTIAKFNHDLNEKFI